MNNKLIRIAEILQENLPINLLELFRSTENPSRTERIALVSATITCHQTRATELWLQAGQQRSTDERRATAQAELAAFLFAYLTGDAREYQESACEALRALGRHGEIELVRSLARK